MAIWTKDHLNELIAQKLSGQRLIVVSNREPYIHTRKDGEIHCLRPASGMVSALDPILRASGGTWIAHGSGSADRATVDARNCVAVPPEDPSYKLRRVWLPRHLEQEYYYGLSNEGLWPLCHIVFQQPSFDRHHWDSYRAANRIFADAVLEEAAGEPSLVLIQDYHLALLPAMLKARNPHLITAQFWHIPWPNRETFRVFPWKEELLDGMLGNDVLGFHLRYHCSNFLDTTDRNVEALVDLEHFTVKRNQHTTRIRPFPIGIDFEFHSRRSQTLAVDREMENWRSELGPYEFLGIGIDRMDYTKGIPQKLRAIDLLLDKHPEYVGKLVFLQVGVPSRTGISNYDRLNEDVLKMVSDINTKWRRIDWEPIRFVHHHVDMPRLMALHRMANFCLVNSLHDGMNLVAKEFVASRFDEDGVLILSHFTGSARELTTALLVNPFAVDEVTAAMVEAMRMPAEERRRRMLQMREAVESNNVYRWAGKMIEEMLRAPSCAASSSHENSIVVGAA